MVISINGEDYTISGERGHLELGGIDLESQEIAHVLSDTRNVAGEINWALQICNKENLSIEEVENHFAAFLSKSPHQDWEIGRFNDLVELNAELSVVLLCASLSPSNTDRVGAATYHLAPNIILKSLLTDPVSFVAASAAANINLNDKSRKRWLASCSRQNYSHYLSRTRDMDWLVAEFAKTSPRDSSRSDLVYSIGINEHANLEVLRMICPFLDFHDVLNVLEQPCLEEDLIEGILEKFLPLDNEDRIVLAAAKCAALPDKYIQIFAKHETFRVRAIIAERNNLSYEMAFSFVADNDYGLHTGILGNQSISVDFLKRFAKSNNMFAQYCARNHKNSNKEVLDILAKSEEMHL